jgi:hypothetical protein
MRGKKRGGAGICKGGDAGWLRFWGSRGELGVRAGSRRRGRQLKVGDDRLGPPVCEREGRSCGVFFPGWSAGPLAPGRPSWAVFSFFVLILFLFLLLTVLCYLKKQTCLKR